MFETSGTLESVISYVNVPGIEPRTSTAVALPMKAGAREFINDTKRSTGYVCYMSTNNIETLETSNDLQDQDDKEFIPICFPVKLAES